MISEKSRKKVRKICIFLPLIVVFSIILILISIFFKHDYANFNFFGMDTFIVVSSDKNIEKEIKQIFTDTENIFNFHDSMSEVSRLNSSKTINSSDELTAALRHILELNNKYGNGADVTAGSLTKLWDITGKNPEIPAQSEIDKALAATGYYNRRK